MVQLISSIISIILRTLSTIIFLDKKYLRESWAKDFDALRVQRSHKRSPSYLEKPKLKAQCIRNKLTVVHNSAQKHVQHLMTGKSTQYGLRASSFNRAKNNKVHEKLTSHQASSSLNMDHVQVPYIDYWWAHIFVYPSLFMGALIGISKLTLRSFMIRVGILSKPQCDTKLVVGHLIIEGVHAVIYFRELSHRNGEKTAIFEWPDFVILDQHGNYLETQKSLVVEVDVFNKRMVHAMLGEDQLTPDEALICVIFFSQSSHATLHAYANWAVNIEGDVDSFVRRNGIVTVLYNYWGYTCFPRFCHKLYKMGLTSVNLSEAILKVFDQGLSKGVPSHLNIMQLMPYSNSVRFIAKTRKKFLSMFEKVKAELFPGIDGESFFIGTVLHSLDHSLQTKYLRDPLWLDADCSKFRHMAQMSRVVKSGFTDDLPGLSFTTLFKDAKHPFYFEFYQYAAKVDINLANLMDVCIVK